MTCIKTVTCCVSTKGVGVGGDVPSRAERKAEGNLCVTNEQNTCVLYENFLKLCTYMNGGYS